MTSWLQCVVAPCVFMAALAVFAAGMVRTAGAEDKPKPAKPTVRCVFVADFCAPCHDLRRWIKKHGWRTSLTQTKEMPTVAEYPTVFYDVGGRLVQDNGQNIYRGNYRLPDTPVVIVEWITKGQ